VIAGVAVVDPLAPVGVAGTTGAVDPPVVVVVEPPLPHPDTTSMLSATRHAVRPGIRRKILNPPRPKAERP
jgi:hypothetical protein